MTSGGAATDATLGALVDFARSLRLHEPPAAAFHGAVQRTLDTIGCAVGGMDAPPAVIARELAADVRATREARVLGMSVPTSAEMAAFANTVMARYLDFNDMGKWFLGGGHPSDVIPALIAVGEAFRVSGHDTLLGIMGAYQAYASIPIHIKKLGWDNGITLSAMGVALGIGVMLDFRDDQLADAISLSVTPGIALGVTRRGELSMWKGTASAAAAKAAVFAALLAERGHTGPNMPFEGKFGLFDQVTGPFAIELDPAIHGYRTTQSGIKRFPSDGSSQAILSTLLDMTGEATGIGPTDIDSIHVRTHWHVWHETGSEREKWDPQTRETADHSLPYLMARALVDRTITYSSFGDEQVRDPSLRPLMARISFSEEPAFTAQWPKETISEIDIRTSVGRRVTERTGEARGSPANPMTDTELEQKFRGLVLPRSTPERVDRAIARVWDLPSAADLRTLDLWADLVVEGVT